MNGPVEPSVTHRGAAKELRQMYVALVAEGFTVSEAIEIIGIGVVLSASQGGRS